MKELLLDANVLLRFLVQDEPNHSPAAKMLFEKAERGEFALHLDALVVLETVYVLTRRYGRNRTEVAGVLLALIQNAGVVTMDADVVAEALRRYGAVNVDFADAWLAARARQQGRAIASFDRDFDKFKDICRFDPQK